MEGRAERYGTLAGIDFILGTNNPHPLKTRCANVRIKPKRGGNCEATNVFEI